MERIAITSLNPAATEKEIRDLVSPHAEVTEVKIMSRMNWAFVSLKDPSQIQAVIGKINGAVVCGQPINASVAKPVR